MKHLLICNLYEVQVSLCNTIKYCKMDNRIIDIGQRLKKLRLKKGYKSYETFAWDNEIPRVQYWRMEKGTNFTISSLLRVLDSHNLTLEDFFSEINTTEK